MIKVILIFLITLSRILFAQKNDFEKIDFRKADSVAAKYKGESLKNIPLLSYKLTSSLLSNVEKFRAIYVWVSNNIESDYYNSNLNKKMRQKLYDEKVKLDAWNKSFQIKSFQKLIKQHKTVCTGYAYLVRQLANLADIDCKIINGYGRTVDCNIGKKSIPNHSWNAVNLNNKWYLCDATWSSGYFKIPENKFIFDYNNGYFLTDPELFAKNHYPEDTTWILINDKPKFSEFLIAPLVYNHAFKYDIIPIEPKEMNAQIFKNDTIALKFRIKDSTLATNLMIELIPGQNSSVVKPFVSYTSKNHIELKYKFQITGYFDITIKYDDMNIVTYSIQVKKEKK